MEALIPYPDLDFSNSDPKIHFLGNLGKKSQSCSFCLKIGTHGISSMLILISKLVFWVYDQKSIFRQIWVKKVKNVRFVWKLEYLGIGVSTYLEGIDLLHLKSVTEEDNEDGF